jgi:hypothetical protein
MRMRQQRRFLVPQMRQQRYIKCDSRDTQRISKKDVRIKYYGSSEAPTHTNSLTPNEEREEKPSTREDDE